MNEDLKTKKNAKTIGIVALFLLVIIAGGVFYYFGAKKTVAPTTTSSPQTQSSAEETKEITKSWQAGQVAIAGNYADAEVADLGDGQFRMYYSIEPEVKGNKLEMYSALSSDGINWVQEAGERKQMATFPDVVKLSDGKWRIYFQNSGVIKSAASTDGLKLTDESGTRIDKTENGFNLENVAAPTTTQLEDGSYIMVYRGGYAGKYAADVPNNNTSLFFYATSSDGLIWEKKGLALDSRNDTFLGHLDGPEWVKWDGSTSLTTGNGEMRLYFWSYKGVYYITYKDGSFSKEANLDLPASKDSRVRFAPDPPGDPTLAKIKDQWFMYYGQHTKGIYYSTLR